MYKILILLTFFIRNFILPNPFEILGDGLLINNVLISPKVLNCIAEPLLHIITFAIVGLFYRRNSAPSIGSLLYLIVYVLNIAVLEAMCWFGFSWWSNVIILALYIALVWIVGDMFSK